MPPKLPVFLLLTVTAACNVDAGSVPQRPLSGSGGDPQEMPAGSSGASGGHADTAPATSGAAGSTTVPELPSAGGSDNHQGGAGPEACPASVPDDQAPTLGTNLALHKVYQAGCMGFPNPQNAFDGDAASNTDGADWSVVGYLAVDLGVPTALFKSVVKFAGEATNYSHGVASTDYRIQGSDDGVQWTDILRVEGAVGTDPRMLPVVTYRYVRFSIDTHEAPGDHYVIDKVSEVELYARASTDPPGRAPIGYPVPLDRTGWIASASYHSEAAAAALDEAVGPPCHETDCSLRSNWSSGHSIESGNWFQVDLGGQAGFDYVELNDTYDHPNDCLATYDLFVSDDGVSWGASVASGNGEGNTRISFPKQRKRYIKVVATAAKATSFWRIADFGVFNTQASACN